MIQEETKNYFKENNYVVLKNFLNNETQKILYQYTLIQAQAVALKIENNIPNNMWLDGSFAEPENQAFNYQKKSYWRYGDPLMDSILLLSKNYIEELTNIKLFHTYSFWRLYEKGDYMSRHIDRSSCAVSISLCLGYDVSNVDKNVYPDYCWPLMLNTKKGEESLNLPVQLNPGDALIYSGQKLEHWRDTFKGLHHSQVFLHYSSEESNFLDNRIGLGLPKRY